MDTQHKQQTWHPSMNEVPRVEPAWKRQARELGLDRPLPTVPCTVWGRVK